jgi:glycerophosphoryl diester phosphodiesterase
MIKHIRMRRFTVLVILPLLVASSSATAPLIIAHRGGSHEAPENTIAAFRASNRIAQYQEFDVRRTRDGRLILMHDPTAERTTSGRGYIADLTFAELRQLSAGGWYGREFNEELVPELSEALATIQDGSAPLLEAKTGSPEVYAEFLARARFPTEGIVASFDFEFIREFKKLMPAVKVGWIGSGVLGFDRISMARDANVEYFLWSAADVSRSTLDDIHALGSRVFVWTVNVEAEARAMVALGVDGIITDIPRFLSRRLGLGKVVADSYSVRSPLRVSRGSPVVLRIDGVDPMYDTLEWRNEARSIIGRSSSLLIQPRNSLDFGAYSVTVLNRFGETMFQGDCVVVENVVGTPGSLTRMAVHAPLEIGGSAVVGFVLESGYNRKLLLRGVGPSLSHVGIYDALPEVALRVFLSDGTTLARMPLTVADVAAAELVTGAFPLSHPAREVVFWQPMSAGTYTAHLTHVHSASGTGLIDVHGDPESPGETSGIINISALGILKPGGRATVEFGISGASNATLLIRGLGPGLAQFGIVDAISSTRIDLHDSTRNRIIHTSAWSADAERDTLKRLYEQLVLWSSPVSTKDTSVGVTLGQGTYSIGLQAGLPGDAGRYLLEIYVVGARQ